MRIYRVIYMIQSIGNRPNSDEEPLTIETILMEKTRIELSQYLTWIGILILYKITCRIYPHE